MELSSFLLDLQPKNFLRRGVQKLSKLAFWRHPKPIKNTCALHLLSFYETKDDVALVNIQGHLHLFSFSYGVKNGKTLPKLTQNP